MKSFNAEREPKLKPGFKVPDNYFENLTERVMQQLPEQEAKVVPLYRKKPVWLSAAAAMLVIALAVTFIFRTNTDTEIQPDADAIENYLVYQANISAYDLVQNLDEQDIQELEQSLAVSDEAIEDYFAAQNNYEIYLNE